ncbi:hypothetical protein VTN31DRAFT_5144 [Thermomyces dupontii]|uniref:uncharacterized protein n=1 Tax=Talaromyces thermophilus TaxID=28565 RepID=UPI00374436E1
MAPRIRVIGSLNADMVSVTPRFPEAGETIKASSFMTGAGGKGANQAVACGRLSRPNPARSSSGASSPITVEMVGAVGGRDAYFESLLRPTLEQSGLDTSRIRTVDDDYTGVAVIIVDTSAGGENRILFSPGANYTGMQPTPDAIGTALAAPVPDVIVMQGEIPADTIIGILRSVKQFREARRAEGKRGIEIGPEVIFNPAPAPPNGLPEDVFAAVDHLIMNETEADIMTPKPEQLLQTVPEAKGEPSREQIARYFHKLGVSYVIITLGARGAWYSATDAGATGPADGVNRFSNETPAAKVQQVRDTTAAGDTFVGGYATHVARWREQRRAQGKSGQDLEGNEKKQRYQTVTEEAMNRAARAAARCVEREGAIASIPWEDEI